VLREFYDTFDKRVAAAAEQMRDVKRETEPTDEICEKCGKPMVIRWGRYGKFIACSGYPECKNTRDLNGTPRTQTPAKPAQPTDKKCGQCEAPMLLRDGRSGQFYGCSKYPKCRYTEPLGTGVDCPEPDCDGELVEKRARKRRKRSSFYGCNRYPKCNFTVPNKPVGKQCPSCNAPFLVEKEGADGTTVLACRTKECDYTEPVAPGPGSDDKTTVRSATTSGGG
jgi:DNA topoisomerase-1